ncbi:Cys-tRNA(Pro) deacylase [Fundicoccus culcitae]|uniref:Cys-tRNA(Pro)/Cys-tRNA(Cys) deacylase n=1 Tax=Fundicoccus culcitae TaxID=2969821 RepID=A0ABY5P3S0_9LACT|nr:Cys-tRNA(Pro) deacylase [Fundicoccus culcitae]UUX33194.1 Cys-tRNA(Pro) deacylase [Fundicoccus culcitae]
MAQKKTNVMRVLEQHKIPYQAYKWEDAKKLALEAPVYKTLVTQGKSNEHYVFVVPVTQELDLKKAAKAVNEKNIHMIKEKELLPLTGYVHGGCSPIGMKKDFVTVLDQSANEHATILISAGKVGFSVEINPADLTQLVHWQIADIATTADE